ncbi:peptidoglycan-binding LysM [Nocardioides sp. CF8]|uniref:LysM peptidoglycan-binding domain-containing protein n=1 Tax=Nocardioides sp. CF8 TaxID=110319 RepID=UPI00032DF9A3|nr:LysM peptidoglycan-binding domain-containing protein [Nocardioides sp. CF8]EON25023.1 peptidoglycan-binding LysM [Nocardioides sp. CF8]
MRLIKALLAGVVLAAIVVGPPWALLRYIGNPWPAEGVSLSAPLTDGAIIGLLAVIVWILWAQLMACILVEATAALTDDRIQLRAPFTLGVQQHLARRLITAVVVATVATPVAAAAVAAPSAGAASPAPAAMSAGVGSADERQTDQQDRATNTQKPGVPAAVVTVMRLDSLWSIAERHLGDGDRWPEIAALNEGRTMNDGSRFVAADHIKPGWELRVPGGPTIEEEPAIAHEVTVTKGHTLSEIALDELGDAQAYPKLFEASKNIDQPGGAHLTDPDLIQPGWTIMVPGREGVVDEGANHFDADSSRPRTDGRDSFTPFPRIVPEPTVSTDDPGRSEEAGEASSAHEVADEDGHTLLRALLATAACLSVGALGLIMTNRRRQFRRRRIGRTIASTPQEVVEVEQAIVEHGSEAQEDVTFLDRALRHVAGSCKVAGQPLPQLGAAVLGEEDLTLLFTHPASCEVPEGWTATDDARAWMLPRWTILEKDLETQPAPYPALVSIGQDEGDRTWLLDLETLGMCGIGGEPQQVADLTRFMVAELAVNAWSEGSEVLLADQFGAETIGLNPARLRQVQRGDALARAAVLAGEMSEVEQNLDADVLTRRRDGLLLDTTNPVVVVVASRPEGAFAADIGARDRSRVVIVHGDEESPAVELAGDGMAFLPMWGISVKAFTLPASEAGAMAALLASTRNFEDEPVPATQSDDGPLGKYARADGSLREEYTEPRHTEGDDPSSMLPDADAVYLSAAATTAGDLAAAAPSVPEATRAELATLDPTLDQDVADWFDESSPRPKVHLLGPVEVTALNGGDPTSIDNLGGTISFIAYLACQDHGVTGERAAAACGWKTQKTVQNRATNARFLLGTRPDGSDWLPDASMSAGARRGTSPTYELVRGVGGVLNSADLFVRLRHRAERRGDVGGCEEDLVTALSLVTGAPFEAATEHRFKWLFKPGQQRHDEILVGAVHDTAHLLATRAVAGGRTDLVRIACTAARNASPHSDIAWLDQAAATEADSGRDAAGELVRDLVLDRFDEDLPPRSEAIVEQREWGATG